MYCQLMFCRYHAKFIRFFKLTSHVPNKLDIRFVYIIVSIFFKVNKYLESRIRLHSGIGFNDETSKAGAVSEKNLLIITKMP
jgi:hypothetical protein